MTKLLLEQNQNSRMRWAHRILREKDQYVQRQTSRILRHTTVGLHYHDHCYKWKGDIQNFMSYISKKITAMIATDVEQPI